MKTLYRIEHEQGVNGLWYTIDKVFNPLIEKFGVEMRMDFDPATYALDGVPWFSACHHIEGISGFIPPDALNDLHFSGFDLYEYEVTRSRELEWHPVFTPGDVIKRTKLSYDLLVGV